MSVLPFLSSRKAAPYWAESFKSSPRSLCCSSLLAELKPLHCGFPSSRVILPAQTSPAVPTWDLSTRRVEQCFNLLVYRCRVQ